MLAAAAAATAAEAAAVAAADVSLGRRAAYSIMLIREPPGPEEKRKCHRERERESTF